MCKKLLYYNWRIDSCLVNIVQDINLEGQLKTILSCCGHDKYPATIIVRNKKGEIFEFFTRKKLIKQKRHRYYKRDVEGYYFVPQLYDGNVR